MRSITQSSQAAKELLHVRNLLAVELMLRLAESEEPGKYLRATEMATNAMTGANALVCLMDDPLGLPSPIRKHYMRDMAEKARKENEPRREHSPEAMWFRALGRVPEVPKNCREWFRDHVYLKSEFVHHDGYLYQCRKAWMGSEKGNPACR